MSTLEHDFMKSILIALGQRPDLRLWRQNTGSVTVHKRGRIAGVFHAGPPTGAADLSGILKPEGWRLEIETKGEKTRETPEREEAQRGWATMIHGHGGVYVKVRYNESLSMEENVADAVHAVENAIQERRSR